MKRACKALRVDGSAGSYTLNPYFLDRESKHAPITLLVASQAPRRTGLPPYCSGVRKRGEWATIDIEGCTIYISCYYDS